MGLVLAPRNMTLPESGILLTLSLERLGAGIAEGENGLTH